MGALTINRKRGPDFYSSNCMSPSPCSARLDNRNETHISKKPKVSPFTKPSTNLPEKVKSRVSMYPVPMNSFKREVHAPCRVTRFGNSRSRNNSRVVEKENSADPMGNGSGTRYDQVERFAIDRLRYSKSDERVINVDEEIERDSVSEGTGTVDVEILENGVHEMEIESDDRIVKNELEPASGDFKVGYSEEGMGLVHDEKMLDLLSLDKKLRLMDSSFYEQLYETAQSRNSKLAWLSFLIEITNKRLVRHQLSRAAKRLEEEAFSEELLRKPFVPLTEEEEALVFRAFDHSNRRKVLVKHDNSNIEITAEILQCLRPKAWLNDEVINVYLELLKERERREPKKFLKCHFFNTFFYKKLTSGRNMYDYKSVRRWTSQRKLRYSLSECEKIFVPIHKQYHWCLAIINKKDKKFQYLDSLGGTDPYVLEVLARYYVEEVKDKSGQEIDISSWEQEFVEDLPAQGNGFDCGVFMVKYADFYSRGLSLCFNQDHMPYFRLRIAKEILSLKAE